MPNKYCDYFDVNESYFPCIDESAINDGAPWETTYPHETFVESFNRFLIISLDVLICRYSPLLRAFPALFISEEPHKSFYYPSCFRSQK